jgi:hypothetical protein
MSSHGGDRPSCPFELGEIVWATTKFREGEGYDQRPKAKAFDRRRLQLVFVGPVNDTARPRYAGELMFSPIPEYRWPYGWIASGDLTDFTKEPPR